MGNASLRWAYSCALSKVNEQNYAYRNFNTDKNNNSLNEAQLEPWISEGTSASISKLHLQVCPIGPLWRGRSIMRGHSLCIRVQPDNWAGTQHFPLLLKQLFQECLQMLMWGSINTFVSRSSYHVWEWNRAQERWWRQSLSSMPTDIFCSFISEPPPLPPPCSLALLRVPHL